jgi:hypothetical protein
LGIVSVGTEEKVADAGLGSVEINRIVMKRSGLGRMRCRTGTVKFGEIEPLTQPRLRHHGSKQFRFF